ncbi:SET domain-containing protein [Pleomassaria siparia CBS 279.74]|uniref:SET domain-containing protein n=1 Tax=Pleomassaria siparia CBS 279.74 TaxID=1314801 RepID=A0A6G1K5X1_9PLEO|nr:SET domain-containing protein [Pleomassaria siparia CBS 279.74]
MAEGHKSPGSKASPFYLARSKICVDATGKCIGDGMFAGCNFGAGENIAAMHRPLVASLDTERLPDTCANCYTWTEGSSIGSRLYVKEGTKVSQCAGCKRFRYCSKACQKEAWNRGHKHECKNLRHVSDKELPKAVLATMELLIRRKHGLIPDPVWDMLQRLDTHQHDFLKNGKYGGIELMALGTSQFSFTQDTFDKDFVAAMYARVLTNSLTLITPTFDPLGIVLDPTLGHINHSCDPNAYIVMEGPEVAIRTLKPIRKDEEIYICYIEPTNPYARRQSELSSRWFFTCKCTKCQKGAGLPEDKWAIKPKDMEKRWKEVADNMIESGADSARDPASFVGESSDEKRVAAIQGRAFQEYDETQRIADPEQAIKKIEDGMRLCYQSGLWTMYRQPYAAFRDDLIVNMLTVGNFQIALAHCAKRYKYILPKLYPQTGHPIRVVQTWQTAMLALYLANEEKPVAPGVDIPVIAYMLVMEVNHAARLSHGENSAFARSVKAKLEEMRAQFISLLGEKADELLANGIPPQRKLFLEMGNWMQY